MLDIANHLYEWHVILTKRHSATSIFILFLVLCGIGSAQLSIQYTQHETSLTWGSIPGQLFDVQTSENLRTWSDWRKDIQANPEKSSTTSTFPTPPGERRYFRVTSYPHKPAIHQVAWLGDSIIAGESNPDGVCHLLTGRLVHTLLRQRISPVANTIRGDWDFGWSGFTSQQLIEGRADLPGVFPVQWVIDSNADTCVVHVGTNNLTWGQSSEMIAASISEVWDLLRAADITVIGTEITPRSGVSGVIPVDNTNALLKAAASTRGMIFAEWNHIGRLADGTADPVYYTDGLHPNNIGATAKAVYLADLLTQRTKLGAEYAFPEASSSDWITPNPFLVGSSGGLASSWQNYPPSGGTAFCQKIVSTDGSGDWQQVSVSQSSDSYNHGYLVTSVVKTIQAGQKYCGVVELESDAPWDFKEISISLGNMPMNGRDLYVGGSGGIRDLPGPVSKYQGILKTPVLTATTSSTATRFFHINHYGSGTFRVRRAGILLIH